MKGADLAGRCLFLCAFLPTWNADVTGIQPLFFNHEEPHVSITEQEDRKSQGF